MKKTAFEKAAPKTEEKAVRWLPMQKLDFSVVLLTDLDRLNIVQIHDKIWSFTLKSKLTFFADKAALLALWKIKSHI